MEPARQTSRAGWWVSTIGLVVIGVVVYFSGAGHWLISQSIRLAAPAQERLAAGAGSIDQRRSRDELLAENQALQEQLAALAFDAAALRTLEQENRQFREQLNFIDSQDLAFAAARVIARVPTDQFSGVVINQGQQAGVVAGAPVIAGEGVLVGRVVSVEPYQSIVRLLNDSQSTIAAMVQNGTETIGIVQGLYGLSVQLDMVPKEEPIAVGDTVVTSGLQAGVPAGLLLGTVESVDTASSSIFTQAVLQPLLDYRALSIVTVLVTE